MNNNLQKVIDTISYQIYDPNDMANGIELKQVFDNIDKAKRYFNNYDFDASYDVDNIADYFLLKKICAYKKEYLDNKSTYFVKFDEMQSFYKSILQKFNDVSIVRFYDGFNFEIEEGYYGLIFEIYKTLPNKITTFKKEIYVKAVEKNPYLILSYYKSYKNVFYKYKELYEILFSDENIKNYCVSLDSRFVEVSKAVLEDNNIDNKDLKNRIIKAFTDKADLILKNTDLKNALHYQIMYITILKFMKEIKYFDYARYEEQKKIVDDLCNKDLDKNGHSFSYEIPTKQIKKELDKEGVDPVTKQISLTHSKNNKALRHYSYQIMHTKRGLTDDLCCSANAHNEHFSMSVLSHISISHQIYCHVLNLYLIDKIHFNDYVDCLISMVDYICNATSINALLFNNHVTSFENGLREFVKLNDGNHDNKDEITEQARSFALKISQFIEFLLNKVYYAEQMNRKVFCDSTKLTLGNILNYNDAKNPMLDILGVEFMQYLSYCLINDTDKKGDKVGLNIRNDLAHANDNIIEFSTGTTLLCLLLLTGVVNSVFLYYNKIVIAKQNKEKEKKIEIQKIIIEQENSLLELQNLQNEVNSLKSDLQKYYNEMMQEIVIPESLQAVAKQKDELRDEKKREELKEFLIKVVKEKLEGTDKYKKYCDTLQESDNKEYEFHLKFLKFYIKIDADRKKLFSEEYFKAIEELSEQGLFFYNLRTPDLPDNLIFGRDRIDRISELYSLQLRKVYRRIIDRKDTIGKKIEEIILYFEDEDYKSCGKQLLEIVTSQIDKLKNVFEYYIKKGDVVENIEYYIETAKKALAYWDKINDKNNINALSFNVGDFQSEEPLHIISKKDCVGLLLYFNNVQELGIVFEAVNYVLEVQKYLKKKDNK